MLASDLLQVTSVDSVKATGAAGLVLMGKDQSKELELEAEDTSTRDSWVRQSWACFASSAPRSKIDLGSQKSAAVIAHRFLANPSFGGDFGIRRYVLKQGCRCFSRLRGKFHENPEVSAVAVKCPGSYYRLSFLRSTPGFWTAFSGARRAFQILPLALTLFVPARSPLTLNERAICNRWITQGNFDPKRLQ